MLFVVWVYRQLFWCCRRIDSILFSPIKKDTLVNTSVLPWMWIGAVYANGDVVDHTQDVNNAIEYGMTVNPEMLDIITGEVEAQWKYLDSKTLEQKDFPSEGFVIDDPVTSEPEDSHDE